jgi:hypothetical protein
MDENDRPSPVAAFSVSPGGAAVSEEYGVNDEDEVKTEDGVKEDDLSKTDDDMNEDDIVNNEEG